jgi:diaminohydroxyphosphoribosylaminopyrimidine deaminase / 5-amino-6-(5-phosphoribosylamino)uracil reductase
MPDVTEQDRAYMRRAIALAWNGWGRVAPNPMVGCVIVRDGEVVGEGWHTEYGRPHAEVEALRAAGHRARGATAYVSLEPCSHWGKTPPCTGALARAGVRRVVFGGFDPNPRARGGAEVLRAAGIEAVGGVEEAAVHDQNAVFFHAHTNTERPFVALKLAMSLDARIADREGRSVWITGEEARAEVHRQRAGYDAVAVGIGTALADDPRLTARIDGVGRQPRRLVFDSEARLPLDSQLVRGAAEVPLTVVVSRAAPRTAVDALEVAGADVILATGENEPARVRSALSQLGAAGVIAILLEGGPHLAGAFLDAGEVDELRLFVAPVLLGGSSARDPLEGEGVERIAEATRALSLECTRVADDVLIAARLREW